MLAVVASGCGTPTSAPTSTRSSIAASSPSTLSSSTTTPTTTPLYSIETCGGITTSSDLHPSIDNRNLLLTDADGPTGYAYGVAKIASGPTVTASVPSYSPAVYESFQVPAADSGSAGQEVIGLVGSADAATQPTQQVESPCLLQWRGTGISTDVDSRGIRAGNLHIPTEPLRRLGSQCHCYRAQRPVHRLLAVVQQQHLQNVR